MIPDVSGIRVVDVLYRVSTRAQEAEGESLFNQRRTVEHGWASPRGITVRRRVEVAESGKSALRLEGAGFQFNRRAEYTALIVEYQAMSASQRPDAVCIDWLDRWNRDPLEYLGLVQAFRALGIRLLAIGDELDVTDQRNNLLTQIRASVAGEQLRITSEKVRENRSSRRQRACWQGGACPDGYRTHLPGCSGLKGIEREGVDGTMKRFTVRACNCSVTTLHRDPEREDTMKFIWGLLERSPLSWQAMTDAVNEAGYRRPNGTAFRWHDLYRIGENPHYCGIMATERWVRDAYDSGIKRKRPLNEQGLRSSPESIPDPYVSVETFWRVYAARFNHQTRHLPRSRNGSVSELTGILFCPKCDGRMTNAASLSAKRCGSGALRRAPRKRYVYAYCPGSKGKNPICQNSRRIRVDHLSKALVDRLASLITMSDAELRRALRLKEETATFDHLRSERARLEKERVVAENARHVLIRERSADRITQGEFETEMFRFRGEMQEVDSRLRGIDERLSQDHAAISFDAARATITWLAERWKDLTVLERAEALRVLVQRVSYREDQQPVIVEYGAGFTTRPAMATRKAKTVAPTACR